MSTTTAMRVPAGWYADPVESASTGMPTQRRWWDGTAWTQHTAPLGTPVSPSVSTESLAAATAMAQAQAQAQANANANANAQANRYSVVGSAPVTVSARESARAAETMSLHPVDPSSALRSASSAPAPSASTPISRANAAAASYESLSTRHPESAAIVGRASARNPFGLRVHTVSVWLMATMPITQALFVAWAFSALPAESSAWTRGLAIAFPLVLMGALASQDSRLMELSGHLRTAPWITAIIAPFVYLGLRGVRVARATGAAPWPLMVWVAAQLGVFAVWYTLDPVSAAAALSALV